MTSASRSRRSKVESHTSGKVDGDAGIGNFVSDSRSRGSAGGRHYCLVTCQRARQALRRGSIALIAALSDRRQPLGGVRARMRTSSRYRWGCC